VKRVQITSYGVPEEVARCVEVPDVGMPGAGEVTFEVLAFPINPADVMFCRGAYRIKPPLPATPGAECVGRVLAIGEGVSYVAPGDLVINLQRENWAQRRRVKENDIVGLPTGIDVKQAAMIRINPPTALLMLTDLVDLRRGEWVLQNAANSAVGKLLIRFARARGLRTVNIVRREASFAELKALGADPQQDSLETAQENILYQSQPQQYALHTYGMEMLHKIIFLTARPSLPASKIADISACVILPYSKASIN